MNDWTHSSRTVVGALLLCGALASAHAAVVVDPTQAVAGMSQLELSQQWWQWALNKPAPSNPVLDTTGGLAQIDNNGPVFFIAGNAGGLSKRSFSVPADKPIFFPVMNGVDIEFPPAPDCPAHPGNPLQCAFDFIPPLKDAIHLHATLDGQDLLTFPSFRHGWFRGQVLHEHTLPENKDRRGHGSSRHSRPSTLLRECGRYEASGRGCLGIARRPSAWLLH